MGRKALLYYKLKNVLQIYFVDKQGFVIYKLVYYYILHYLM